MLWRMWLQGLALAMYYAFQDGIPELLSVCANVGHVSILLRSSLALIHYATSSSRIVEGAPSTFLILDKAHIVH